MSGGDRDLLIWFPFCPLVLSCLVVQPLTDFYLTLLSLGSGRVCCFSLLRSGLAQELGCFCWDVSDEQARALSELPRQEIEGNYLVSLPLLLR